MLQSCPDEIKDFELIPPSAEGSEETSNMSIGELKTKKFKMRVNKKTYDVYPDLRSLIYKPWQFTNRKGFEKLRSIDSTLAIGRQVVLAEYYEELYNALKKEAGSANGTLNKTQLEKAVKQSLQSYHEISTSPDKF